MEKLTDLHSGFRKETRMLREIDSVTQMGLPKHLGIGKEKHLAKPKVKLTEIR